MSEESSLQIDSTHDILFAEQILKMRNKKWKTSYYKTDVKKSN
jgi:hypothetical protein